MAKPVELVRIKKAKFPDKLVGRDTLNDIGKVGAAGIIDNILKQIQADGTRLQQNKQSTKTRKSKAGNPLLSLVDEDRSLVRGNKGSFDWRVTAKGVTIFPATSQAKKRSKWVQEGGKGRNKYTGWFGISKTTRAAMKALVQKAIKKAFKKVSS